MLNSYSNEKIPINIDLHIHSCHSACGSLDMGPKNVINRLSEININIAAISDHNSMKNCDSFIKIGQKNGLCIFPAMEVQSEEEIHSIVIFPDIQTANNFQNWIDSIIPIIPLNSEIFGDQPIVDEDENIVDLPGNLLSISIPESFNQIEKKAFEMNLLFFPAHINSSSFSIISQIGFIPENHLFKIAEVNKQSDIEEISTLHPEIIFITNSDAHYLDQIGLRYNSIYSSKLLDLYLKYKSLCILDLQYKTKQYETKENEIEQIKKELYFLLKDCLLKKEDSEIKLIFNK